MPYSPATRTAGQVMTQVRRTFGDEAAVQVSDADLLAWINDAQQEIVNQTKVLKAKSSSPSVVGQSDYTFPTMNLVEVDALHYNGVLLTNVPFAAAEQNYIGSTPPTGQQPRVWWEYAGTFTLWPAPVDVRTIDIYATVYPPTITDSSQILGLTDKFYRQIVQYVLQQAYELDEDLQAAGFKQDQFRSGISTFNEEERVAQHMVGDTITLVDWDE